MINRCGYLVILTSLIGLSAFGAPTKRVSGSAAIGRSNSLYEQADGNTQSSMDLSASLAVKLSSNYKVSTVIEGSQDLKNEEASDLAKGVVAVSHSGNSLFNKTTNLKESLSIGLPVSRAQKAASFQGSVGLSLRLDLDPAILVSNKLDLSFLVSGSRSFHEFETSLAGKVNTQTNSMQGIETGWSFTENTGFSVSINHYNSWSYLGTMKEFYSHAEELSHRIDNVTVALGHALGSPYVSVWKSNYQDYNYALTDDTNSLVYISATLGF